MVLALVLSAMGVSPSRGWADGPASDVLLVETTHKHPSEDAARERLKRAFAPSP